MTPSRPLRPGSSSSAKALLLTVLGEFVLAHGGALWTSTAIDGLGALGIEERNARQALARLTDDGFARSEKHGRRARWHLTDEARQLLIPGSDRIYGFGTGDDCWDERWLIVLCPVPEQQRAKRHQLRSRLAFAGFGFLGAGIAVTPHTDREPIANGILKELGLLPGALVLRAGVGEVTSADEILARAWDLGALARRYEEFDGSVSGRAPRSDEARFAALVEMVHSWRRFPFSDPEIPRRLLPPGWPGHRAKALFDARHAAWAPGANRHYEELERRAGT